MDTAITWRVDCNALFAREKMVWAPEMRHYTEGPIGQQHQFPVCPVGLPSPQLYYPVECVLATAKMSKARGDHFLHTHALRQYCCYAHFSPTLVSIERTAFFFELSVLENQYSSALKDFLYFYRRGAIIRCITSQIL